MQSRRFVQLSRVALMGMVLAAGAAAQAQTFRILPPLEGHPYARAYAISNNGLFIVGETLGAHGSIGTLWDQDRKPRELPLSCATAVSDDATVIAGRGVVITPAGAVTLEHAGIYAMDAQGTVVVGYTQIDGAYRAFSYFTSGTYIDLPPCEGARYSDALGVNRSGTLVVGFSWEPSGFIKPCIWSSAGGPPLVVLDCPSHIAYGYDISEDGRVVVGYRATSEGDEGAARWVDGVFELIVPGGPDWAGALSVSDDGVSTVGYDSASGGAFLWDPTHGARYLRQMMIDAGYDMTDLGLGAGMGISGDGRRIAGMGSYFQDNGQPFAFEVILETNCPADFNADFVADFFDYLDFVALYDVQNPRADFNGDQTVDFFDYLDFVAAFEAGCD